MVNLIFKLIWFDGKPPSKYDIKWKFLAQIITKV